MKRILFLISLLFTASFVNAQTQADELKMKTGEMGGRGQVWRIEGRPPQNGVILEITAVANPIAANVTNDLKPSPDWFLYFIVEITNERSSVVVFSKRYDFLPRGGILRVTDTVAFDGKPGNYRTTFRFDTQKIADNSRAQVIRIQEGTIRTLYTEIREKAAVIPGEAPKKRFKVD